MKVVALIFCVLAVASASPEWENFKAEFKKSYTNPSEERFRKSVFMGRLKSIEEHNELYKKGESTYYMKINEYSDMTNEEFIKVMTGGIRRTMKPVPKTKRSQPYKDLDTHMDWRDRGAVGEVKNQGQCGSCWSFSAAASLEGMHFIKTGKLLDLSEQNLMDCSTSYGTASCNGGWPYQAYEYIRDNKGIDSEESYPYTGKDSKTCKFDDKSVIATIREYVDTPVDDEKALQVAVQYEGPISVCIDVIDSFQSYGGGVYYDADCDSFTSNHAVTVVGFGVDDSDGDYWIVKNSWGKTWGEKGYIRMARNRDNNCAIATFGVYPVI